MSARRLVFGLALLLGLLFPNGPGAEDSGISGTAGTLLERFEFQLTWIGIRVGTGVLEIRENGNSREFTSTARSSEWVSRVYPVNNYALTEINEQGFPLHYENIQKEGRYRSHKETFFGKGSVRHLDHLLGKTSELAAEVSYHDVLSAFLASRRVDLAPGQSVHMDVFDDGRGQRVEIRAVERETIDTAFGRLGAVVIETTLESDGLFRHRGPMRIWLSEDERKLPLRLEARVVLGAVRASLVGGVF